MERYVQSAVVKEDSWSWMVSRVEVLLVSIVSQVEVLLVALVSQVEVLLVEVLQVFSMVLVRRNAVSSSSSARTLPAHKCDGYPQASELPAQLCDGYPQASHLPAASLAHP